jgi:hypothetical protein
MGEGTLVALPAVPSVPSTPAESTNPVEQLLRAKAHLHRAASFYANAGEELRRCVEALGKARQRMGGGETRAAVHALESAMEARRLEATHRGTSLELYATSVEGWALSVLPVEEAPATPAPAPALPPEVEVGEGEILERFKDDRVHFCSPTLSSAPCGKLVKVGKGAGWVVRPGHRATTSRQHVTCEECEERLERLEGPRPGAGAAEEGGAR